MDRLIAVENLYHDFFSLLHEHYEMSQSIHQRAATARLNPADAIYARELPQVADALTHAIFAHVERSESAFRDAASALPAVLRRNFGRKGIRSIDMPTYTQLKKELEASEDSLRTAPIIP